MAGTARCGLALEAAHFHEQTRNNLSKRRRATASCLDAGNDAVATKRETGSCKTRCSTAPPRLRIAVQCRTTRRTNWRKTP